jgi:hypothetical protein
METALAFRSKDKAAAFEKYWAEKEPQLPRPDLRFYAAAEEELPPCTMPDGVER